MIEQDGTILEKQDITVRRRSFNIKFVPEPVRCDFPESCVKSLLSIYNLKPYHGCIQEIIADVERKVNG